MEKIKSLFSKIKMNWLTVIIFAVVTGVYTGFIMLVPFLKETSFQDIGISYEWWVIFAVIVVTKCQKSYDAMLKCFVFFLISQPLVYAVEVIFGSLTFELASHYYLRIWLPMTMLTLPGGFIAYFCKKQNALGGIIMGLGNTIQVLLGIMYAIMAAVDFPHHLLSAIVCFASAVAMSLTIHKTKTGRLISLILPVVLSVGIIIYIKLSGLYLVSDVF